MELKDMILSTIAELENTNEDVVVSKQEKKQDYRPIHIDEEITTDEKVFLKNVQEKILVLFEGLQAPKNDNIDTRLDITLNFLEFLLASIEERMKQIK